MRVPHRIERAVLFSLPVAAALAVFAAAEAQQKAPVNPRTFKPPRIAVLESSRLFDGFNKMKDAETRLKEDRKRVKELKDQKRQAEEELKSVQPFTKRHRELALRVKELEYDALELEQGAGRTFLESLSKLRLEVKTGIEKYAEGRELDLVLERKLVFQDENGGNSAFPVVHYARPELDITSDLIELLNR
jgi:Skp family chaperone for outer membrane proteins